MSLTERHIIKKPKIESKNSLWTVTRLELSMNILSHEQTVQNLRPFKSDFKI